MDSLGKKAGVSFASGAAPVPSSDSVDSADAEYNGVKQLSITESSAESRASEARIPEPQFPSLLLSLCHTPPPASRPCLPERRRRRLISVAPLNVFSRQNERLSDLLFHLALCVPSIRNENRLICRRTRGYGRRHSVFRDTVRRYFGFPYLLRGVTPRFSRLPRATLRIFPFAARYALLAPPSAIGAHCLIPYRRFWSFHWYCYRTKIVILPFLFFFF